MFGLAPSQGPHGPDHGVGFARLDRHHLGQAVDEADGLEITQPLEDPADDVAIAHGHQDAIWRLPAELLADLQRAGLLAFPGVGVGAGVAVVPTVGSAELQRQVEGVVVAAVHREHPRPEDLQLGHLGPRGRAGHEDHTRLPHAGAQTRHRRASVARGGRADVRGPHRTGMGQRHRRGPILERRAGVACVVLEVQVRELELLPQPARRHKLCAPHHQRRIEGPVGHRQQRQVAQDRALTVFGQALSGEHPHQGRVVEVHLEVAAAAAADEEPGVRRVLGQAAHAA